MVKNIVLLLVVPLIVFMFLDLTRDMECFTASETVQQDQVRFIASNVGSFIGQIYLDIRNTKYNSETGVVGNPFYKPTTYQEVKHISKTTRDQIKYYIDSGKKSIRSDWDKTKWDIAYKDNEDSSLLVLYTENGNTISYLV